MSDSIEQNPDAGQQRKRTIRSFVKRTGRMTESQQRAMDEHWQQLGLTHEQGQLDLAQVFGREAPLVVEVGFGNGDSLVEMAQREPEKDFIGIEVHEPGVGRLINNVVSLGLTNLRAYCHDAVEVFSDCIADESIDRMQLFFPDPWHKKRHHKRRIVQPEFVEMVRRKLKKGGVWHMATDWEHYAEQMMEVMSEAPGYKNVAADGQYVPRPDTRPLTKFEQRGERLGHGVWDLMFERID
ncbi:tRNA (guanosine(46)-N7)-methyltransferase TrmB [Litoribrevibacter euphylliae]|uniref:tRNA (guanine-N(7)-)-methyltransferase n=1 Tax=Litoribrevibacter euphylliae TaxID=1834034 RepID=A0ABV7HH22_9GAMM